MSSWIFSLMFLSSAPIFLMPAAIALHVRRSRSAVVVFINLALWALLYFAVRSILNDAGSGSLQFPLRPGVVGILIGWLILLRYVIADTARRSDTSDSPT